MIPTVSQIAEKDVAADVPWLARLLRPLNQALKESSAILRRGITLQDNAVSQAAQVTVTVPDDWTAFTTSDFLNSWTLYSDTAYESPAWRKHSDGTVETRGTLRIGTATILTPFLRLPAGTAPPKHIVMACGSSTSLGIVQADSSGYLKVLTSAGAASDLSITLRWTAADRSPPVAACWPAYIACALPGRPRHVWLTEAREVASNLRVAAMLPDWDFVSQGGKPSIVIRNVPGLTPGRKYVLTFLAVWR